MPIIAGTIRFRNRIPALPAAAEEEVDCDECCEHDDDDVCEERCCCCCCDDNDPAVCHHERTASAMRYPSKSLLNTIQEEEEEEAAGDDGDDYNGDGASSLDTGSTADTTESEDISYHYSSDDEEGGHGPCISDDDDDDQSLSSPPAEMAKSSSDDNCCSAAGATTAAFAGISPLVAHHRGSSSSAQSSVASVSGDEESLLPPYPTPYSTPCPSDQETSDSRRPLQPHRWRHNNHLHHNHQRQQQQHSNPHGNHQRRVLLQHLTTGRQLESASLPQLQENLLLLKEEFRPRHEYVGRMWNQIGNAHFRVGEYDAALEAYKEAVNCELGSHLGDSYSNIGTVYWAMGKVGRAIDFLRRARKVHEYFCLVGNKDPSRSLEIATVRYQVGLAYTLEGSYKRAIKHLLLCRDTRVKEHGHGNIDVARVADALGRVHMLRGDYPAALRWYEEALRIKHTFAELQDDPSVTLSTMQSIASVHRMRGDTETAILTYCSILQAHEELLERTGTDWKTHRKAIAETLTTIGEMLTERGQFYEARQTYGKAMLMAVGAGFQKVDIERLQSKLDELI